jgi:hypothetical protein
VIFRSASAPSSATPLPVDLNEAEATAIAVLWAPERAAGSRRIYPTRSIWPAIIAITSDRPFAIIDDAGAPLEDPREPARLAEFIGTLSANGAAFEARLLQMLGRTGSGVWSDDGVPWLPPGGLGSRKAASPMSYRLWVQRRRTLLRAAMDGHNSPKDARNRRRAKRSKSLRRRQGKRKRINEPRPMKKPKQRCMSVEYVLNADEAVYQPDIRWAFAGENIHRLLKNHDPSACGRYHSAKRRAAERCQDNQSTVARRQHPSSSRPPPPGEDRRGSNRAREACDPRKRRVGLSRSSSSSAPAGASPSCTARAYWPRIRCSSA